MPFFSGKDYSQRKTKKPKDYMSCFLKWWYLQNTPKMIIFSRKAHGCWGNPTLLGKLPYTVSIKHHKTTATFEWRDLCFFGGRNDIFCCGQKNIECRCAYVGIPLGRIQSNDMLLCVQFSHVFQSAQLHPDLFLDLACQLLKKLRSFGSPRNLQKEKGKER